MFFDVEDAIVARLVVKLAATDSKPRVYTAQELTNIKERSQSAAAVFVAYNGISSITPLAGNPSIITVDQDFVVWTVTRSASRHGSGEGTRELADPILVAILDALCGWRPVQGVPPLALSDTSAPAYEEGFGYFPLAFRLTRQIRGNPN